MRGGVAVVVVVGRALSVDGWVGDWDGCELVLFFVFVIYVEKLKA